MKIKIWICFKFQPLLLFLSKILAHLPYSLFKPFVVVNNKIRVKLSDYVLDYVVSESGIFKSVEEKTENNLIGNLVLIFWYTGYESAPPLIKKCIDRVKSLPDIDFHLITRENIPEGLLSDFKIKDMPILDALMNKMITIQQFSDILRHYLLSHFGGYWVDATIFVIDQSFFCQFSSLPFYTIKYSDSHFFYDGLFSSFLVASGKNDYFLSLSYEIWKAYYKYFAKPFDYFLIDFIWYYLYRNNKKIKKEIDEVSVNKEIYDINDLARCRKEANEKKFNMIMSRNCVQKITYKGRRTVKALEKPSSMYMKLLSYGE